MPPTWPDPERRVLFGVAYYPEYHTTNRLGVDLDLMTAAKINVIRVGESVWSTWEPREGEFDLEWIRETLDAAHVRGIGVILGTPTYAVPPWLQTAHPEIAGERRTGEPIPWGARQEVDYSHPAFRFYAERIVRRILDRYASHPAVIGYQVDNEPGLELLHNHGVFTKFVRWLKEHYKSVDTLNREWGLTYWSHRINDWSELWRPDGNTFPQYDLAWRRFQAKITTDFIGWQTDIVREYSVPGQFVTTCLQYPRRGVDDRTVFETLDVVAGNPYYGMQERLAKGTSLRRLNYWTTSGVAGLLRQADRIYSSRQQRFLVTETNAQAIDGPENNHPPYPGQLTQSALAFVSRGASMIEYWHWHSLPFGAETYWGGVLPHSLVPGRVYEEVANLGAQLSALGEHLHGYEPDADAAVLWSTPSRYAMQFMPPLAHDGAADDESYERIFDAFHGGVIDANGQARILHVEQAESIGPAALVRRFPVVIAAGAYILTDSQIELLREYARLGGHLVLGPRTAYADSEARARVQVAPAGLADAAGVRYEEFSNLDDPIAVTEESKVIGAASAWVDGLLASSAVVEANYGHPHFGSYAAVTKATWGDGQITVVGTVPDRELAARLASGWLQNPYRGPFADLPDTVTVSSGVASSGVRFWFIFNWSWSSVRVALSSELVDATSGNTVAGPLSMGPWDVRVLRDAEGAFR